MPGQNDISSLLESSIIPEWLKAVFALLFAGIAAVIILWRLSQYLEPIRRQVLPPVVAKQEQDDQEQDQRNIYELLQSIDRRAGQESSRVIELSAALRLLEGRFVTLSDHVEGQFRKLTGRVYKVEAAVLQSSKQLPEQKQEVDIKLKLKHEPDEEEGDA